jgi:hypothetical protein
MRTVKEAAKTFTRARNLRLWDQMTFVPSRRKPMANALN